MMRGHGGLFVLLAGFSFLSANLMVQAQGQNTPNGAEFNSTLSSPDTFKVVVGKVSTPQGNPVAHATVEITNNAGSPYHNLLTDDQGEFRSEYNMISQNQEVKNFTVSLKVTKKGFQAAYRMAEMGESVHSVGLTITLRPLYPEDPTLLPQADLINGVAPRLRQIGPADGLSAKQEKDYARGVQEFLDRDHVDQAVPFFFKVAKLNPSCLRCRTMLALADLSWGDWDDARHDLGETINAIIAGQKPGSPEPFLTYGVMLTWGHDPQKAGAYFREALKYSPQDALALQELARVQCLDFDWFAANETLKKALAAGAGPEARLLHAEALLWAGTPSEATAELNFYLNGRDPKNMPPRVRTIWANIQARKKDEAAFLAASVKAQARGEQILDYLHHPPKNLPDFEPTSNQAPMEAILAAVGKNVAELFADLPNVCSVENVHQQRLGRNGKEVVSQEHKYRYLAVTPNNPWGPSVNEYRADLSGKVTDQMGLSENSMLTSGFVGAPLIFHPAFQRGSSFRLLGRQKVHGRNTFVIAYAQEPGKSRISGSFQQANSITTTYTQGLAWIDGENYQILRLTSDLLRPVPVIRLEKETTEIDFSEVQFKRPAQRFWLPEAVTVTLDWNGKVFRNQHAYSDFLVSNVESTQKIGKPKGGEKTAEEANDPGPSTPPLEDHSLLLVPTTNN
jgi:tetratricopeptide (TPR) repeat protein